MRTQALCLLIAGTLAGCGQATTTGSGTLSPTPSIIAAIQNDAVLACAFLPTAETVASIITAATGAAGSVAYTATTDVANAICGAVSAAPKPVPPASGKRLGAVLVSGPKVNGVVIQGYLLNQ